LAKPNYQFEKRQRDLSKKNKQEEKRRQKLAAKTAGEPGREAAPAPAVVPGADNAGTGNDRGSAS